MYTQFFGLSSTPFSIAPDPRYLFMSERHREALAHLLFGLDSGGGFVLLTGEIGAGKTTVCRLFLEQIPPRCNVAYIFNPKQTVIELLQSICDEFGIDTASVTSTGGTLTVKNFIDPLNQYLLATHAVKQNNVLIIDEAQNLSADVLEQLRLLTNLETNERKLLQIVLIGQPELRTMLAQPQLEQLAQRVIARFHLDALSPAETLQYIAHRLRVAGNTGTVPFTKRAMRRLHRCTRGVPRRINLLCDRALLSAYAKDKRVVDAATVDLAAREVFASDPLPHTAAAPRLRTVVAITLFGAAILGGAVFALQQRGTTIVASTSSTNAVDGKLKPATVIATPTVHKKEPMPAAVEPSQSAALSNVPSVIDSSARDLPGAYRRLGKLWQLVPSENDPCVAAQKVNVYCFRSSKGLADIRQLDRPGILTLYDDAHQTYYALLVGLASDRAVLQIGEQLETVSLNALAHRWEGDYATYWRGPPGARRGIAKGERGPAVEWLVRHLSLASGTSNQLVGDDAVFDTQLSTQVREFQLSQGLRPDGVAGAQTLMRLVSITESTEPRLYDPLIKGATAASK